MTVLAEDLFHRGAECGRVGEVGDVAGRGDSALAEFAGPFANSGGGPGDRDGGAGLAQQLGGGETDPGRAAGSGDYRDEALEREQASPPGGLRG